MTRALFALVLVFVGWIAYQATGQQRRRAERAAAVAALARDSAAEREALRALQRVSGKPGRTRALQGGAAVPDWVQRLQARRLTTPNPAPARDAAGDSAQVRRYGQYTYLEAVAAQDAGKLSRWPARTAPLRVWVQRNPGIAGWTEEHASVVRGALRTWDAAQLPFRVEATADSGDADVFVLWSRRFAAGGRIGETNRVTDAHGWIVAASVTIALEDTRGEALDVYTVQNAARHELGHVLGLDHSPVADDIMAAWAGRQDRLSERDVNTARLLYALAPGPYPGAWSRSAARPERPAPYQGTGRRLGR